MVRAQRQQAIERVGADVPAAFGDRLACLALYGSAATDAFSPERSDLNFAIVLDRISFDDLTTLRRLLPAWHKLGVATPLLIDLSFLEHARDVFPMELADLRATHRTLAGRDVFSSLQLARADLRRQLEQEGRGKLLRLRVQYAETGGKVKDVRALMVESVGAVLVLVRGVLRLCAAPVPDDPPQLLAGFATATGERLDAIGAVTAARAGGPWAADVDAAFRAYLDDVERLIGVIDRLPATLEGDAA